MLSQRQILENGMTMKIVEYCNKNRFFKKEFIALFTDKASEGACIEFTGNDYTEYGRPDITITFKNGSAFYIEVKTKNATGFTENQVNNGGYIKLIEARKQELTESFAYLLNNGHSLEGAIEGVKVVYWNTVYELVNDCCNDYLCKEIENNVENAVLPGPVKLNSYEVYIMNNPKLMKECFNLTTKMFNFFNAKEEDLRAYLNGLIGVGKDDPNGFLSGNFGDNCEGKILRYKSLDFLYFGFSLDLLKGDDFDKYSKYAFGIRIKKEPSLFDLTKWDLEKNNYAPTLDFYEDDSYIYIPINKSALLGDDFNEKLLNEFEGVLQIVLSKYLKS